MAQYNGYTVAYENNRGNKLVLTELPYACNIENLLDYSWAYATRDRRRGSRIAGFNKGVASGDVTIHVLAKKLADRNNAIDAFNNVIDVDIYDGIAGKMWFNDWFTYGYITGAKNSRWQYGIGVLKKDVTFVREEETWFHVISKNSYSEIEEDDTYEAGIKDYELNEETGLEGYDYDYDYGVDRVSSTEIINPNPLGCDFIINITGPVNNPVIRIGNTTVNVNIEVPAGAILTVDSTAKTIIMTYADGLQLNVFSARNPDYYIFQKIESGHNAIVWDGSFNWDLMMIEERSEPRWLTG